MSGSRTRPSAAVYIDCAVLAVLATLGLLGFATAYDDGGFLLAGVGGILVGTGAALLASWMRWNVALSALVAVGAYFLFGSALALGGKALFGVVPTLDTLADLALGAVFGWADVVTLLAPVGAPEYVDVLPYLCGFLAGLIGATLASRWFPRRGRDGVRSMVAVLPAIALFAVGLLIGTDEPYLALVRGGLFVLIALGWVGLRPVADNVAESGAAALRRRRLTGTAIVVATGLVAGGGVAAVAGAVSTDRFVLREHVAPPFDPLAYPSPLSGFRKYTKDLTDTTLFTVTGLEEGDLIRIATMDAYDGRLWNVTDAQQDAEGSGAFRLVSGAMSVPRLATSDEAREVTVAIADYADVWLPEVGYPTSVEFDEEAPPSVALRHNVESGVTAITTGVGAGMRYRLTAQLQVQPSDEELADVPVATVAQSQTRDVPDIVSAKAIELAGDAVAPIARLRAIEKQLKTLGFLSHGAASDQAPSSAGHGADRIKLLLERPQWVGDQEQFAATFALMARSFGYPARVVMGFAPDVTGGETVVTGDDVTAWVEVAFEGVGWVAFDPTPDETDVPQDLAPQPKSKPQPQVRQPPNSHPKQDDLVSSVDAEDDDQKDDAFQIPAWVWTLSAAIGIPLLLVFAPVLIIAAVKATRRRRRRRGPLDHRVAGAWDELVDSFAELGYSVPRKTTRRDVARELEGQVVQEVSLRAAEAPELGLAGLAADADRAVFDGRTIDDSRVDDLWRRAALAVNDGRRTVSGVRRVLSRYRIRPKNDVVAAFGDRVAEVGAGVSAGIRRGGGDA